MGIQREGECDREAELCVEVDREERIARRRGKRTKRSRAGEAKR